MSNKRQTNQEITQYMREQGRVQKAMEQKANALSGVLSEQMLEGVAPEDIAVRRQQAANTSGRSLSLKPKRRRKSKLG